MTRVILIFALMFVLAWAFWRFVDGIIEAFGGTTRQRRQRSAPMKLVRDPVCGTFVAPGSPEGEAARRALEGVAAAHANQATPSQQ